MCEELITLRLPSRRFKAHLPHFLSIFLYFPFLPNIPQIIAPSLLSPGGVGGGDVPVALQICIPHPCAQLSRPRPCSGQEGGGSAEGVPPPASDSTCALPPPVGGVLGGGGGCLPLECCCPRIYIPGKFAAFISVGSGSSVHLSRSKTLNSRERKFKNLKATTNQPPTIPHR